MASDRPTVILRRVPTSMLVALGLLPIDACKCPLGPCLEPAIEDPEVAPCLSEPARPQGDAEANPCLTAIPPDDDAKVVPPPPDDGALTPCLSVPEPLPDPCLSARDLDAKPPAPPTSSPPTGTDPKLTPCLSVPRPSPPPAKGGGKGAPPAHEPFATADVVRRVLDRGDLPADVLARLRGRA